MGRNRLRRRRPRARRTGATVVDEAELIAHAKQHLARFKVPKRVVFVAADQLPTTATGKVQKFRLGPLVAELDTSEGEPS